MIKLIILSLIVFNIYLSAWNSGYDIGLVTKQSDDILRGTVTCYYTARP